MCGIAALLLHPHARRADEWRAITDFFTRNLVHNQARGQAATGIARVQQDGELVAAKMPKPADEFTRTAEYANILAPVNAQTTVLLGHTRHPTKGAAANNANNHPLHTGPVWGVHNGHIANDDALFERYHFARQAQVDSEIIFHLLAERTPAPDADYLRAAAAHLRQLQGDFTFLACDQRAPTRLLALKHNHPLCAHWHPEWGALIFSSRYIFLRQVFGHPVLTEALPHDHLLLFDATALPPRGLAPLATYPLFE